MRAQKDALEVGIQHPIPPRLVAVQEVPRLADQPRIVDQHMHVAEVFERSVKQSIHTRTMKEQ